MIGISNVFIRLHEGGVVSRKTAQLVSVTAIIDSLGKISPIATRSKKPGDKTTSLNLSGWPLILQARATRRNDREAKPARSGPTFAVVGANNLTSYSLSVMSPLPVRAE
jgi:hypothetical protein